MSSSHKEKAIAQRSKIKDKASKAYFTSRHSHKNQVFGLTTQKHNPTMENKDYTTDVGLYKHLFWNNLKYE